MTKSKAARSISSATSNDLDVSSGRRPRRRSDSPRSVLRRPLRRRIPCSRDAHGAAPRLRTLRPAPRDADCLRARSCGDDDHAAQVRPARRAAGSDDLCWRCRRVAPGPAPLLLGALAFYILATALTILDATHPGAVIRERSNGSNTRRSSSRRFAATPSTPTMRHRRRRGRRRHYRCALGARSRGRRRAVGTLRRRRDRSADRGVARGPNQLSAYCTIAVAILGAWSLVR